MLQRIRSIIAKSYLNELIKNLRDSGANGAWAEKQLIDFEKNILSQLHSAANDPNPHVRFRAVHVLGKIGDPKSFDILLQRIDDADERVRFDAIMSIGHLGDKRGIQVLQSKLDDCPDGNPDKEACLQALARINAAATKPMESD